MQNIRKNGAQPDGNEGMYQRRKQLVKSLLFCFGCLTSLSGCGFTLDVLPDEKVIETSEDRDFGFAGTWILQFNSDESRPGEVWKATIVREGDYEAAIECASRPGTFSQTFQFRAEGVTDDGLQAIIEVECRERPAVFSKTLFFAAVRDDELQLWSINETKLRDTLFEEGVPAIFEDGALTRCDANRLLGVLKKRVPDVVANPAVLKRQ